MTLTRLLTPWLAIQCLALLVCSALAEELPATTGKMLFAKRCGGCHSPDINKEGPRLSGVYGRKAASVSDFAYSNSFKKLDLYWDETSLDRWLVDPSAMAPETDMSFQVEKVEQRKALIAYLKTLIAK